MNSATSESSTPAAAQLGPLADFAASPCLIYPASRSLTGQETTSLTTELRTFLSNWASHGSPVEGAGLVIDDRFLVVAHRPDDIAGCSRDSLLFFLKDAGARLGVEWVGGARVFYRDGAGQVVDVDRPTFRAQAAAGVVTPDTVVYDTTVRETASLLEGRFTPAARDSWHARLM
jgi:hypothetical protein